MPMKESQPRDWQLAADTGDIKRQRKEGKRARNWTLFWSGITLIAVANGSPISMLAAPIALAHYWQYKRVENQKAESVRDFYNVIQDKRKTA